VLIRAKRAAPRFHKPTKPYPQHHPTRHRGEHQTHCRHFGHGERRCATHADAKLIEEEDGEQERQHGETTGGEGDRQRGFGAAEEQSVYQADRGRCAENNSTHGDGVIDVDGHIGAQIVEPAVEVGKRREPARENTQCSCQSDPPTR